MHDRMHAKLVEMHASYFYGNRALAPVLMDSYLWSTSNISRLYLSSTMILTTWNTPLELMIEFGKAILDGSD